MLVGMLHTTPIIGALFMEGTTETGERILIIRAENPDRIAGFPNSVTKAVLERFHLESFQADHVLRLNEPAFEQVWRGKDPPDFRVMMSGASVALDCASFADHHHRNSFRLMQHLRQKLIDGAGGRDFSGVSGCLISVWFGSTGADLPPKRSDDSIIDPLLDAIAACQVDFQAIKALNAQIAERGFPQVMPPVIATGTTPDETAGFVANVLLEPTEGLRFSSGLGFEVQLSRPIHVTMSEAITRLQHIVRDHDQPEIDHLLLTAGAPDSTGYRYPAEEAIAKFLLQDTKLVVSTRYLKQVTVHLWFSREIAQIPVIRSS